MPPRTLSLRIAVGTLTAVTRRPLPYDRYLPVISRHNSSILSSSHVFASTSRSMLPSSRFGYSPVSSRFASNETENADEQPSHHHIRNDIKSSLFPRTIPDPKSLNDKNQKIQYPKTFAGWKRVFMCAWKNYKFTWEGFRGGGSDNDEEDESQTKNQETKSGMETMIDEQRETVTNNVERNTEFIQKEAPRFFDFVQQETKIYTKEDLKQWAGEQLKLATLCVNEFMGGYRSGRDGEMDKMLNEYFQEEEDEADEDLGRRRKRRKPKRLVRSA